MQAKGLPRDPANADALRRRRMRALRRHDWVVYAQVPSGRSCSGARLPGALHAPHGHRQRATRGHRRRQGPAGGARRRERRQANDRARRRAVHRPTAAARVAPGLQAHPPLRAARAGDQSRPPEAALANSWRCRRPTLMRARTRRPSCGAWPPSMSTAARIAVSDAGEYCSTWRPIVWR